MAARCAPSVVAPPKRDHLGHQSWRLVVAGAGEGPGGKNPPKTPGPGGGPPSRSSPVVPNQFSGLRRLPQLQAGPSGQARITRSIKSLRGLSAYWVAQGGAKESPSDGRGPRALGQATPATARRNTAHATPAFEEIAETFEFLDDWKSATAMSSTCARHVPWRMRECPRHQFEGCASQVWICRRSRRGRPLFRFRLTASMIVRGLTAVSRLYDVLTGASAEGMPAANWPRLNYTCPRNAPTRCARWWSGSALLRRQRRRLRGPQKLQISGCGTSFLPLLKAPHSPLPDRRS